MSRKLSTGSMFCLFSASRDALLSGWLMSGGPMASRCEGAIAFVFNQCNQPADGLCLVAQHVRFRELDAEALFDAKDEFDEGERIDMADVEVPIGGQRDKFQDRAFFFEQLHDEIINGLGPGVRLVGARHTVSHFRVCADREMASRKRKPSSDSWAP